MALALLLVFSAACSGSEPAPSSAADRPSTDATTAATTGETRAETAENAPSADTAPPVGRREWRTRFYAWLNAVRPAATQAGLVASDKPLRRQAARPGAEQDAFTASVSALADCEGWVDELSPPPRSYARATRLAERACGNYLRAAGLLEEDRPDPAAFGAASRELRAAARHVARANRGIRRASLDALPLPVRGGRARSSRIEPVLTRVARAIRPMRERVPLAVRCWSARDWERLRAEQRVEETVIGFVVRYTQTVNLAPSICDALVRLAYSGDAGSGEAELEAAVAVGTLSHEAAHVYQDWLPKTLVGTEAVAECWGMQYVRPTARLLGATAATASRLATSYWTEIYPYMLPKYRSDECRNGGFLDRRRKTDVWP